MYQHLVVESGMFVSAEASVIGRVDSGLFVVEAVIAPGADIDQCEKALWKELYDMHNQAFDEREITKLKNKFEANHNMQNINFLNRAQNMAHCEAYGDVNLLNNEVERYCKTDAKKLNEVAKKFIRKSNSNVLRYLAKVQ